MTPPNKATNITWHEGAVSRSTRAALLRQTGGTVWLTGLSACGKSSIAVALEQVLISRGHAAYVLDGDNIRHGLNRNLGFSAEDRAENIRRIGEVAKLFADAGLVVICSFISPYRRDRDAVREAHKAARGGALKFLEVFVDAPLDVCESRDPKGLYKKARAALAEGKPMGFTGIDDPYEPPLAAEVTLATAEHSVAECVATLLATLEGHGFLHV